MRAAPLLLLVASCLDFSITKRTQDGGTPAASDAGSAVDAGVFGAGCGVDPVTGVTLCTAISTCPGLSVDQGAFPGCGFRVSGGTTLDLECLCGDALCPVGVAATCAQAKQLLANQTQPLVCMQVNEGRCVTPTRPGGGCDKACASQCGGDPTCLLGCGC